MLFSLVLDNWGHNFRAEETRPPLYGTILFNKDLANNKEKNIHPKNPASSVGVEMEIKIKILKLKYRKKNA